MSERILVIKQTREYSWSNHIVATEFEAPGGLNDEWVNTGRGAYGLVDLVPSKIASAVEPDETLVFVFGPTVSEKNKEKFRKGIVNAMTEARSEKLKS